jgi:uncharacterized membrane protein (UPF0127 family)
LKSQEYSPNQSGFFISEYTLSAIFKVMKSIRTTTLFLIAIAFLLFLGFIVFPKKNPHTSEKQPLSTGITEITIGNSKLYVEKALNEDEWSRGLSNRTKLNSNNGMLFVFPTSETKIFWMKDTLIPLDIIWVANNKVVGLDRMLPELNTPLPLLKRYISPSPVDDVIETNLDWTVKNGIKINDKISY